MIASANFFWNGKPLSHYEYACISSFVKNDFNVQVFTFDPSIQLPPGAMRRDAGDVMPEASLYSYTLSGIIGSMAGFADAFRCNLIKKEGGWWFDADVLCIQHADRFRHLVESKRVPVSMGFQNTKYISNAVLYTGDDRLADALLAQLEKNGRVVTWGDNGPRLVTQVVHDLGYGEYADPVSTFYPVDDNKLIQLFEPAESENCHTIVSQSLAIHLWNDVIRRLCIPKNILPPEGSFLYKKFTEYAPELARSPTLPAETMRCLFEFLRIQKITSNSIVKNTIKAQQGVNSLLRHFKI